MKLVIVQLPHPVLGSPAAREMAQEAAIRVAGVVGDEADYVVATMPEGECIIAKDRYGGAEVTVIKR